VTRIIAVMMYKGGAAKSTTVNNVGAAMVQMGQRGKRVLVVDLDWQGNATSGVGFDVQALPASINDLFADPDRDPRTVILQTDFGLDVLPASPALATTAMNMQPTQMFLLRQVLGRLEDSYDVILIDTPPGAGYMTYNAQAAATDVLIPVGCQAYGENGLAATIASVREAQQRFNPGLRLAGIVPTLVERRTTVSAEVLAGVRATYGRDVLPFEIPKAAVFNKGNAIGIPGVLLEPRHPAVETYKKLARRLL
jgi:chromosome partitioning protein